MTVTVQLRGALDTVELDQEFTDMVTDLNVAAASGKMLMISRTMSGDKIALAIPNILSITEDEDALSPS